MSQKSAIILLKWADIGHFLVWVLGGRQQKTSQTPRQTVLRQARKRRPLSTEEKSTASNNDSSDSGKKDLTKKTVNTKKRGGGSSSGKQSQSPPSSESTEIGSSKKRTKISQPSPSSSESRSDSKPQNKKPEKGKETKEKSGQQGNGKKTTGKKTPVKESNTFDPKTITPLKISKERPAPPRRSSVSPSMATTSDPQKKKKWRELIMTTGRRDEFKVRLCIFKKKSFSSSNMLCTWATFSICPSILFSLIFSATASQVSIGFVTGDVLVHQHLVPLRSYNYDVNACLPSINTFHSIVREGLLSTVYRERRR